MSQTICAISTAYGIGGIAVVRVSGPDAIRLVDSLFHGRKSLLDARTSTIHYGQLSDVDEVLVSVFRAPHSFTGEDVVEIACHGSLYIQQEILRLLIDAGACMAKAGEFTQRAFLNGKMDLTQAEAVADLIAAQSKAEKDLALSQLRGGISDELSRLRERLLHFTSLLELELDFADHEDLEFVDRNQLSTLACEIEHKIATLCSSFRAGNAIRNGIPVAIVGLTNAGKSTLLNTLLGEERAIVSDIHGTTRDTIEDTFILDGVQLRLIDTAGIRETNDTIEALGIERSRKAMNEAEIIICVQDAHLPSPTHQVASTTPTHQDEYSYDFPSHAHVIRAINKVDTMPDVAVGIRDEHSCYIAAKSGEIAPLLTLLRQAVGQITGQMQGDSVCISNIRHYQALTQALEAIHRVQEGMQSGLSGEFLSIDLQDCLSALGEITGQITSQEVLENIFSRFCIGK